MADGSLRESDPGMGTGLSAFLATGETLPDLRILMVLAVRRAERRLESLIAAEEARRAARVALGEARREREHAAALLRGNLRRSHACRGRWAKAKIALQPSTTHDPRSRRLQPARSRFNQSTVRIP